MQNTLAGQKDLGHITKNETLNMYEYECPQCYALDRDRLVVLFLQELFDKCLKNRTKFIPLKILDIAPSAPVGKWIKNALTNTSTLYLGTKNQTQNVPKLFWKDKIPCTRIEDLYCDKNLSENKYNYYIDSVKFEEHILTIWGWFYFEGVDSKKSKLKLILRTRRKTKICEFIWRNRPDIDQHFNAKHDGTLLWSGIDIQIDMAKYNFKECDLELRIIHGNSYASIPLGNICRST